MFWVCISARWMVGTKYCYFVVLVLFYLSSCGSWILVKLTERRAQKITCASWRFMLLINDISDVIFFLKKKERKKGRIGKKQPQFSEEQSA